MLCTSTGLNAYKKKKIYQLRQKELNVEEMST
jgi:hypothetical protein